MPEPNSKSLAQEMLQCIHYFPAQLSAKWTANALVVLKDHVASQLLEILAQTAEDKKQEVNIANDQLTQTLAEHLSKDLAAAAVSLEKFRELRLVTRESKWIGHVLSQRELRNDWHDIAMSALADKDIIAAAERHQELANWIAAIPSHSSPPPFADVVPPLGLVELKHLRQSVDRTAKRLIRSRRFASQSDLQDEAALRAHLPESPPDHETLCRLQSAIAKMPYEARAALYMKIFEKATLKQIQSELGISSLTSTHRLVRSSLAALREAFSRDND